jgi:hypothetical protein
MSPQTKNWRTFFVGSAIPLLLVGVYLIFLFLKDVRKDRRHTITVNATTPIFVGTGDVGGCKGKQLTTIGPGAKLPVRRIRYLRNCAAVDVRLPDGRTGYVVLGMGDVSVNPPLPTI